MNLDYLKKTEKALNEDIFWNIPEQKTGIISIIGGNSNNFSFEIKQAEFLNTLNLKEVRLILPDSLKSKVPPVPGVNFTPATESGSFDKSSELNFALSDSDLTLLSGDFSKNSATSIAILNAIKNSEKPVVLSRDAIDLISESAEEIIEREGLIFVASMSQLQKLFRNLLYPKMLLLGAPLLPVVETLHKFTLSYPVSILTFHDGKIITAKNGKIISTKLEKTEYSPISLWDGRLAAKISAFALYNPKKPLESLNAALFKS